MKFTVLFFPDSLPEKVTLSSSGAAGDTHYTAMGVYSKLSGLTPVWAHTVNNQHKLFYDGNKDTGFGKSILILHFKARDGL